MIPECKYFKDHHYCGLEGREVGYSEYCEQMVFCSGYESKTDKK